MSKNGFETIKANGRHTRAPHINKMTLLSIDRNVASASEKYRFSVWRLNEKLRKFLSEQIAMN